MTKGNMRAATLLLVSFLISSAICGPREYEETCNPYKAMEQCRMDLDLICEDNECVCKDMSYYDEETGACIAMIGETCTHIDRYNYYGSSTPISRCPTNAVCQQRNPNKIPNVPQQYKNYLEYTQYSSYPYSSSDNNHRCFCKKGYTVDDDKYDCTEALKGNEVCVGKDILSGCDKEAGLTCDAENTKTCICKNSEDTFYSEEEKRCLTKLHKNCTQTTSCEKNSICSVTLSAIKHRLRSGSESRGPSSRKIGKCECLPGYTLNTEGKCVASFGVACTEHNPCNSEHNLECIEGMCQCQAGLHQVFSNLHGNGTCKFLVNAVCDPKQGAKCVENAECDEGTLKCKCIEGYSPSPAGQCLPSHLTECTSPDLSNRTRDPRDHYYGHYYGYGSSDSFFTHDKDNVTTCNFYQGLACYNSKCQCFDSALIWDEAKSMCMAGENERCGPIMNIRGYDGEMDVLYPSVSPDSRPGPHPWYSYHVGCKDGLKCIKDKDLEDGQIWRVCEPIGKIVS